MISKMHTKQIISIMPDFGMGPYACEKSADKPFPRVGGNIADIYGWPDEYPVSQELHKAFSDWIIEFENNALEYNIDWPSFHTRGWN